MIGERRYRFVLYAALAIAGAATFGVYRVITAMRASSRVATRAVVVAAADIPEGAALTVAGLSVAQWPEATVPAGVFDRTDSLIGRVARVAIFQGEPLVPGRLAPSGTTAGLEVKITPGKRAMAVRIDDVAGLSGLIQPNSRVDVLVTLRDKQQEGSNAQSEQVSKLFMSNMRVLSIGSEVQRGADGKAMNAATAALEVTPDEAERLAVAMREGTIQLVMRGYGDPDSISTDGADAGDVLAQLRGGRSAQRNQRVAAPVVREPVRQASAPRVRERAVVAPPPPVVAETPKAPPKPESTTVRVYRGSQVSQQQFQTDTAKRPTKP
jgi:pilus assembly protein CpaB